MNNQSSKEQILRTMGDGAIIDISPKEYCYHYTTLHGFLGICESKSFWLSNAYYLNDTGEIKERIVDMIGYFRRQGQVDGPFMDYLQMLRNQIFNIYVFSFSRQQNSLSQWRGYAGNGIGGVAIGISQDNLEKLATEFNLVVRDVIYDRKSHVTIYNLLKEEFDAIVSAEDKIPYAKIDAIFLQRLAELKSNEFEDEKEVRLISQCFVYNTDPRIKYRTRPGIIIPYIEVKLDNLGDNIFEHVVVGPCKNLMLNWKAISDNLSAKRLGGAIINSMSTFRSFD